MTNCIKPPGYVVTDDGLKDIACKMRNCPVCSRVMRNQLMDRVTKFFADDTLRFMTVTMQADDKSDIMDHWHVLLVDIKRHYPGIRGFWVKEFTKRGVRHLHVLVTRYVDQAWLQRRWQEITGTSWNIKIKKVDESFEVKNPAAYMLKYMTKAHNHLDLFNKGERIYGFFGARAPPKELLGFEKPYRDIILDQHFNPSSKYWFDYVAPLSCKGWKDWEHPGLYNIMQRKYGLPFIDYMERMTTKHKGINSALHKEFTWWLEQRENSIKKDIPSEPLSLEELIDRCCGEDPSYEGLDTPKDRIRYSRRRKSVTGRSHDKLIEQAIEKEIEE